MLFSGGGLVVGRIAEREEALELPDQHAERGRGLLREDPATQRRVAQPRDLLGERQRGELAEARVAREGMERGLEPEQDPDRARRDLRLHRQARRVRGGDVPERGAPRVGRRVALSERDRHRAPRLPHHLAEQLPLLLATREVRDHLEHALPRLAEHAADAEELVRARREARREAPVARAVILGARGREAERARAHGVAHDAPHRLDLGRRRRRLVVGAALAHHVEAQRRVRHLRAHVERVRAPLHRVEVLGEALPVPAMPSASAVPGMSSTPSISLIR